MSIEKIGIVGTGTMGLGMAQVCAGAGKKVVAVKATPGSVEGPRGKLQRSLDKAVDRGKMDAETRDAIMNNISFSDREDDLADCHLVVESIVEDLELKTALFKRLEGICPSDAILTTNTSTLSVTAMMAACENRGRVAGLHFFNPAPVMKLVEVVHAFETTSATIGALMEFCTQIGKDPVLVQDSTGFIVNRLLTPLMLNAIRMLERNVGTIDAIDKAMMLGAGYPMGPLALADYIGLDVVIAMSRNIFDDSRNDLNAPPHTLVRLVELGYLGRKTGRGFYDYSTNPPQPNPSLRHPVV